MSKHDEEWFSKNKDTLMVLKELVPDGDCFMEIGAFDGVDIGIIRELWGKDVDIHAFEPSPENFLVMENIYGDYDNVTCNQIALTNFNGTTDFYLSLDTRIDNQEERHLWYKTASSLRPHTDRHKSTQSFKIKEEKIKVDCMTVDKYCEEKGITPKVMFLDTQGSEYEILEGAKKTLNNVKGLVLEYSTEALYKDQHLLPEIIKFLNGMGFVEHKRVNLYAGIHGEIYFIKK